MLNLFWTVNAQHAATHLKEHDTKMYAFLKDLVGLLHQFPNAGYSVGALAAHPNRLEASIGASFQERTVPDTAQVIWCSTYLPDPPTGSRPYLVLVHHKGCPNPAFNHSILFAAFRTRKGEWLYDQL